MEYKDDKEQLHKKVTDLAFKVSELESENMALCDELNRIKNSRFYRMSAPLRKCFGRTKSLWGKLKRQGSVKGVLIKVKSKLRDIKASGAYGTESFPDKDKREEQKNYPFKNPVKISILVPVWNNDRRFHKDMIESVMNQTYENWELCLADGSDSDHAYIEEISREYAAKSDNRVVYKRLDKNMGISGNTNQCFKMATGEYIGLLDQDDVLHPEALFEYMKAIEEKNADYIYCDEATFKGFDINKMITLHFKPDYAPDNLRANNYICHFSVFKRSLLDNEELFRTAFDGSQDHDMILRLTGKAKNIVHVPRILYYWRSHALSVASDISAKPYAITAAKKAVADSLINKGFENFTITSTKAFPTIFKIRYEIKGEPMVSIIIPNKDHKEDLKRCLDSVFEKTTYSNYEIIIVENNSETKEIKDYYSKILGFDYDDKKEVSESKDKPLKIVNYKKSFNYSAVNNLGRKYASGEYLVLLNNDTAVISVNWIEELLMYAQREDVACVGAKLYYEDKTIQHAGVILGMGAHHTAGHCHYGLPKENFGYMGRLCYAQNFSAVTGACLMVAASKYDEVSGLSEDFAISLNDVDFCLKLREKGYLNVFTPFAELYHFESKSRGLDTNGERLKRYEKEALYFRDKWGEVVDRGDPYFNPNFSLEKSDFCVK
ncbi:MAG: glycosyltransferase family 2 protein [Lachnospiraceae bacterium]|nr:glycosyltransferase family 2 protein [Lachnospiraceae bacterium]